MKVTIGGEEFAFDPVRRTMADALAIEKIAGKRYVEWENDLYNGSAEAACVLVCFLWRREGRQVDGHDAELADLTSGKVELDFSEVYVSVLRSYGEQMTEAQAVKEADPTGAGSAPAGTPGTPPVTKRSSRKSST